MKDQLKPQDIKTGQVFKSITHNFGYVENHISVTSVADEMVSFEYKYQKSPKNKKVLTVAMTLPASEFLEYLNFKSVELAKRAIVEIIGGEVVIGFDSKMQPVKGFKAGASYEFMIISELDAHRQLIQIQHNQGREVKITYVNVLN